MNRTTIRQALFGLALALAPLVASAQSPNARPPGQISYQSYLTDANGIPLATNTPKNYNILFRIYNDATATAATNVLWGEQQVVTVDRGFFTVQLGAGSPIAGGGAYWTNDLSGVFSGPDASSRYVGITVQGLTTPDAEIAPRLRSLASPYALLAATANNASNAVNAVNAANAVSAQNAANAVNANNATTAVFAATATNALNLDPAAIIQPANLAPSIGLWGVASGTNVYYTKGRVGIGQSSPTNSLDVNGNADVTGAFTVGGTLTGTSENLSGNLTAQSATINFLTGQANAFFQSSLYVTLGLNVTGSASIGGNATVAGTLSLGNATGIGKLSINSGSGNYNNPNTSADLMENSGANLPNGANFVGPYNYANVSIYAGSFIVGSGFVAFSDDRIKHIDGHSDSARDLATLQGIEITDYRYIDTVAHGSRQHKKVIAQQVEQVFPQAVGRITDCVPDIYTNAVIQDGWVKLATDLKVGDRVRLIDGTEQAVHEVLEVRVDGFRTEFKPAAEKIFVYGREVKDFRSVDYEAISMLNVSATQELARQLAIKNFELAKLRAEVDALEARDAAREARLARLESHLNETTPHTVRASLERK